jgi:glycosyltransferase involved in cell wall biosynthesis
LAIYVVTEKTGRIKERAEASPRIMIATDAATPERVPETVRLAADLISTEEPDVFQAQAMGGANGVIAWIEGDQLLQRTSEEIRGIFIRGELVKAYVPTHLPCLIEAEFIGLQPRISTPGATKESILRFCRIRAAQNPSALARKSWEKSAEPWAKLHVALLKEQTGSGLEQLKQLWQELMRHPLFGSLILRNLVVALIKRNQTEKAEELLSLGMKAYPGYAEFSYLLAVLNVHRQKPSKAVENLERAMQAAESWCVGGGGENSYRASWLLGAIYEDMGEEARAASCFLPGVLERPAFEPSVSAILRQRFSGARAGQLSNPLCEMVRREPHYLEPVFDFFLRHRVFNPARRLLKTLPLAEAFRQVLEARLSSAEIVLRAPNRQITERPGVILEGPFLSISGHARINTALGRCLLRAKDLDAALEPSESGTGISRQSPDYAAVAAGMRRSLPRLDLTVRHCWPPDFRRPDCGRLACIVPWEHRAVPRAWVREIEQSVDELWVPSHFVAEAFVRGGVSRERVQVIPNGFAPETFNPQVDAWRPPGCKSCVFLFVGGTIRRKGADLLLQAYADAFSPDDDVTLIFKDTGSSGFYQYNNLLTQIRRFAQRHDVPGVLVLTERMDDARLSSLYRGCDAFVLPYRGEGFGMPLVEAMACGKPVLTTAAGPALEFCSTESAYLISATEVRVPDPPPPFGEFSSEWSWFEPDLVELTSALRSIYENRQEAEKRGVFAAGKIAQTHPWSHIMRIYLRRIAELTSLAEEPVLTPATLRPDRN